MNTKDNEIRVNTEDNRQSKTFKFDRVFDGSATQEEVFRKIQIANIVNKVVEGYHSTIFAYGQTGSGKTYTMEGYQYQIEPQNKQAMKSSRNCKPVIDPSSPNVGLIPRAISCLFGMIEGHSKLYTRSYKVYCSFLQIYNEKIYDLLNPS